MWNILHWLGMDQGKQGGFTLIEILITLVIAAIVLGIGIPSFTEFSRSSRLSSDFKQTLGDLVYARSEAVVRNAPIAMCPSVNQSTCSNSTDWNTGWIMFVDDGNGSGTAANRVKDGTEQLLRIGEKKAAGFTVDFQNKVQLYTKYRLKV